MKTDKALAMKVETPKSLASIMSSHNKKYTPIQSKFFGYAQMPRQMSMPYQNEPEYQKLLKRHLDKGHMLRNFDFPRTQGKGLRDKTNSTQNTLTKYSTTYGNRSYGERITLKLSKPD